jgi:non-specific serine/threonine protein kinase
MALHWRSEVARRQDQDELADALMEQTLSRMRRCGDLWTLASTLFTLGCIRLERGDPKQALHHMRESLKLHQELGARGNVTGVLEGLAWSMSVAGHHARAARLFGAAEAEREAVGVGLAPQVRAAYPSALANVRAALGETRYREEWSAGRDLSLDEATVEALAELDADGGAASAPASIGQGVATGRTGAESDLTAREREVAALIGEGRTSREIAELLVISERTADTHADRIRTKLGLRSRAEIAAWAVRQGFANGPAPDQ